MMSMVPSMPGAGVAVDAARDRDVNAVIVDASASLIIVLDSAGRIVRFNHACEEASGYSLDEVRGRVSWDVLLEPGAPADAAREMFARALAGEFPRSHESDWLRRDGGRRRIVWSNAVVPDSTGKAELIVGCGDDITERRQIEVKLRE